MLTLFQSSVAMVEYKPVPLAITPDKPNLFADNTNDERVTHDKIIEISFPYEGGAIYYKIVTGGNPPPSIEDLQKEGTKHQAGTVKIPVPFIKGNITVYAISTLNGVVSEITSKKYTVDCLLAPIVKPEHLNPVKGERCYTITRNGSESADIICYAVTERGGGPLKGTDQEIVSAIYERERESKPEKKHERFYKFTAGNNPPYIADVWRAVHGGADDLYFYAFATENGHVSPVVKLESSW